MNKQEAIEKVEGNLMYTTTSIMGVCVNRLDVIDIIKKIDEPEKPVIPQFVADWIDVCKENLAVGLYTAMNPDFMKENSQSFDFILWIKKTSNQDIFARAWLDGYEIEKEKLYKARLKITTNKLKGYINKNTETVCLFFDNGDNGNSLYRTHFTRAELEELNVWDNPAFEIKEVE
ncbi:DUF1642 domain-containing protein [Streptococcus anginosus]|uniref:DUF1642 domain-containing protein n=1 Tax=Streptococcus anginosus TaxID=1328 RepID=A0AAW5TE62_STRAP|nr:DUF1642 domain-containing protein [Streptococcus anginosus]MCW1053162.1 DUF1642 domain-containing protein [Streptococcus anginosus]MCW1071467.1 DUF1642 domain-containing protein [Streptococcus anginosus]